MLKNILTVLRKLASAAMNFLIVYFETCLLYTSDAADEEDRDDFGGPQIDKNNKK